MPGARAIAAVASVSGPRPLAAMRMEAALTSIASSSVPSLSASADTALLLTPPPTPTMEDATSVLPRLPPLPSVRARHIPLARS